MLELWEGLIEPSTLAIDLSHPQELEFAMLGFRFLVLDYPVFGTYALILP